MTSLHGALDQVFSTYRAESAISAFRRGELYLADAPDDVHEVLALAGGAERAFSVWRPGLDPSAGRILVIVATLLFGSVPERL